MEISKAFFLNSFWISHLDFVSIFQVIRFFDKLTCQHVERCLLQIFVRPCSNFAKMPSKESKRKTSVNQNKQMQNFYSYLKKHNHKKGLLADYVICIQNKLQFKR